MCQFARPLDARYVSTQQLVTRPASMLVVRAVLFERVTQTCHNCVASSSHYFHARLPL